MIQKKIRFNSDHKYKMENFIIIGIRKQMRRRQIPPQQDPKQLNAAFLLKFAKMNYEGKNINPEMLNVFSNFLQHLSENILKKQQSYTNQTIKAIIDIAITVQFNLHMAEDHMSTSSDIEPIIKFLQTLFNFVERLFLFQQKSNNQKITQVFDLFWPLLASEKEIQKVQVKQFDKIASALQKINNLPYIYEIEPYFGRISSQSVIGQSVEIGFLQENLQFSTIFRSVLSKYNEKNRVFIESFLTYFQSLMNQQKDQKALFQKCFNLLINISNCVGQKYNYIEIFFNRLISSSYPIRNFTYALAAGQEKTRIQKYYSNHHLLTLSFIIIEKILNEKVINKQSAKALQIISKISAYWIDITPQSLNLNDFTRKINTYLLFQFLKFVVLSKKSQNIANPFNPSAILQNSLIQAQKALFESGELDSKKIYEFFKQYQMKSDSQEGDQWMDNSNKTGSGKVENSQKPQIQISLIKNFSTIIQNLSKNKTILNQLRLNSLEKLEQLLNEIFTKQSQVQNKQQRIFNQISSFITKRFPILIPNNWNEALLKKCLVVDYEKHQSEENLTKNGRIIDIFQTLLVKKLQQTETFSKMKQDFSFQEFVDHIFNLTPGVNQQILNFHFLIFYIFIKKCSSLSQKDEIAQLQSISLILVKKLNQFIEEYLRSDERKQNIKLQENKKSMLILQFFLIVILDHPSGSFKLSLKNIITQQCPKVGNTLDLQELMIINQKQTANSFFNSRSKMIIGFSQEGQSLLCKNFFNVVEKLNQISFPENYLKMGTESKQEKKMKIFLNIRLNNISLSLRKSHKVPELIKNINLMRKTNSINSFQIILFSFCEYFEGLAHSQVSEIKEITQKIQLQENQKKTIKISESKLIVAFNYLLKINLLILKFNENANQQSQNDISQRIYALQDIHSLVQQALIKIQHIVLEQNRTFELKTLIKILENIKESNHSIGGIAQKYNDFLIEGQMIKLISELTEDREKLRIQFSQLALVTMKKLLNKDQKINQKIKQLQKIKLEQKSNQMSNQNQENLIIQEQKKIQEMKDLSVKLKQLHLMYYPYKHDLSLGKMLRVKTQLTILQLLQDSQQSSHLTKQNIEKLSNSIVQDLLKNISLVKQIIIKENQQVSTQNTEQFLWNFKYAGEIKFISFIVNSILKMFSSSQKDKNNFKISDKIFSISSQVLENEEISQLTKREIGKDMTQQFIAMISGRVEQGCILVKKRSESISPRKVKKGSNQSLQAQNKQIKDFHSTSIKLYNIIKKVINLELVNSEEIVNSLILKDNFSSIQVTKFIMAQLINVSIFIKTKSDDLTQTVFSYVIKANESYLAGKNQLQIPQFLCEFFNISHGDNIKNQIQSLQKSQRSTNTCTSNISYRCLKCDDKRLICYSCAVQCHKDHPIIYLSQQRYPKCQCRQIGIDQCKLVKKVEDSKVLKPERFRSMFSYESREPLRSNRHQFFMMQDDRMYEAIHGFEQDEFRDSFRFGGARIRKPRQFESLGQENIFSIDPLDRAQNPLGPQLLRQERKIEGSNQKITQQNFDFEDQNYQLKTSQMQSQESLKSLSVTSIESQSYLLPVFLQMFNDIYSNNEEVSSHKISSQNEKFGFSSLGVGKIMHNAWRGSNAGSYTVRLRKENQLNNKSPAVSKQVIAQNHKFILVSSGSMIFVHSKERYFMNLLDGKQSPSLANINQYTGNFDIHTIDFSPLDELVFIISGLHNILMLNISNDGVISKNTHHQRVNVNNDYINKVRTSSLGIFYSTSYEIKLLNWTFKPVLTIKSSAECLLKQWCLYEKTSGCTVYCVTAHGYTEYLDVTPSDQGKKFFTNKVVDGRKVMQTGSSILVKDVEKVGKVYLASFKDKDGSNIIGNLQGDTVQNTSNFLLRNNFVDHFGKRYLIGQSEIIKGSENQIFVVCTIRQQITPQISINQGQLAVFQVKKDKKCEFQLINTDNKCENFTVIPVGDSNWSIASIHDDGSLYFSILHKPQKQVIDQQCKKLKDYQPANNQKNVEKYSQLKQTIKKTISQETLSEVNLNPVNYFREFSEHLKSNNDYKISKRNLEYQITMVNNNKIITGFTLPFIGNVYFPHRTVKNIAQVGLSNLQVLYYFSEGTLKFRLQKVEDYKPGMESLNQKFKEKYQKLERLNQLAMDSERAMQILNTIKQVEAMGSDQVQFYGQSVDSFKSKTPNFAEIFNEASSELSKQKKIQKMATLLQIFIQDSIKNQNYLCQPFEILEFVKNLRKISLGITKPQIYHIIKNLIVSSLKMYEAQMGTKFHVFNDEFYPLKYATEQKADIYYEILKGQISDNQVEESINFWSEICNQDLTLGLLYLSKYPSLLPKIHKKSKKIDKIEIREKLLKLYVLGYQVLKFKDHNCEWVLGGICSLFTGQQKNKGLRETFYQILMNYSNVQLQGWLKNVQQVDGEQNVSNVNLVPKVSQVQESSLIAEDNMAALYGQFDMGEMDEQAMLKMAIQLSEMQMKQNQQNDFGLSNANNVIEEQKQNIDDQVMLMEHEVSQREIQPRSILLKDLIGHCTKDLAEPSEIAAPKIIVLYVISKYVNQVQDIPVFNEILNQIAKILSDLSPSCDNIDKNILMAYFSVFSNILSTSKILKNNLSETASNLYLVIKEEVINRLQNLKPQKVNKLKNPPNLLGRIFRGEKIYTFAHYAYGLVSLLLPPCQPLPILLSLECYWLLPQSKQFYTKMKHMTTIKEGITTGNINKVYEVAIKDPEVWRQIADIIWLESCIQSKNPNWQKALELLALYYQNGQISQ